MSTRSKTRVSKTIALDIDEFIAAEDLSQKLGVTFAEIIRRSLAAYLPNNKETN